MRKIVKDRANFNANIWCLVIYIQYMTLPIKQFYGSFVILDLLVVSICIILLTCVNGISVKFLKYFSILIIFFLIDYCLFRNISSFTFFFIPMLKSSLLMFYCTLNLKNINIFIKIYYKYSLLTLFFVGIYIVLYVINGNNEITSHMGIGNVLTFIFIAILLLKSIEQGEQSYNNLLLFFTACLTLFFGNRMAIISEIACLIITIILSEKNLKNMTKRVFFSSALVVFLVYIFNNIKRIFNLVTPLINSQANVYYSLLKFQRMFLDSDGIFSGLVDSSSGRNILYEQAIELAQKVNYFPRGVSGFYFQDPSGYIFRYPHNIFLELLTSFGFLAPIILVIFSIYTFIKISKMQEKQKKLSLIFLVFAITKLLVSSSFWLAPSLAIFLGLLFIKLEDEELE